MELKDLFKDKQELIVQLNQIAGALIYIDQKIKKLKEEPKKEDG